MKIAKVKLTIEFNYPLPDMDEDTAQFVIEENHCCMNYIEHIYSEFEDDVCNICHRSEAEFLGFLTNSNENEMKNEA